MSFVLGSIRLFYLTQLKNDLQYKIMLINESKMDMARSITDLMSVGTDLDSENPIIKDMKARRDKLELMVKQLDAQLEIYKSKMQAVDTEIQGVREEIKNSAQIEFRIGL